MQVINLLVMDEFQMIEPEYLFKSTLVFIFIFQYIIIVYSLKLY